MPALTSQDMRGKVPIALSFTLLDGATDTFELDGTSQYLVIKNDLGVAATASMIGDEAQAEISCPGYEPVTTPSISIDTADGTIEFYPVSSTNKQLSGVVTITGGNGLEAALIQV